MKHLRNHVVAVVALLVVGVSVILGLSSPSIATCPTPTTLGTVNIPRAVLCSVVLRVLVCSPSSQSDLKTCITRWGTNGGGFTG